MTEADLMRQIMIDVSATGARAFRNNVARGVVGDVEWPRTVRRVVVQAGDAVVRNARVLHAGLCEGSSDVIGVVPVTIRQEHVGLTLGLFLALEVKSESGRPTPAQTNFVAMVDKLGGLGGIVRSSDEALALVRRLGG